MTTSHLRHNEFHQITMYYVNICSKNTSGYFSWLRRLLAKFHTIAGTYMYTYTVDSVHTNKLISWRVLNNQATDKMCKYKHANAAGASSELLT